MKQKAIVFFLGVLLIGTTGCFNALAEPPGPPPGLPPHGGGFFGGPPGPPPGLPPHGGEFPSLWDGPPDLIGELKLTDDQRKQIRLAYVEFQEKTRKARNALMGLHDEKKTMLISGKMDQARLTKLDEETTKLASEVMGDALKMKREQLSKLTPEQVDRLSDFLSKRKVPHGPKMMGK